MKNTITISRLRVDFLENRAHGDAAFPCAAVAAPDASCA